MLSIIALLLGEQRERERFIIISSLPNLRLFKNQEK